MNEVKMPVGRVLVRTVGTQVRGVLSDSYRRLNSVEILTAFVQEAAGQGAVISDAYMNDTKVWAETILPTPITIPTAKNGNVVIFAGARFSTSDYGVSFHNLTVIHIGKHNRLWKYGNCIYLNKSSYWYPVKPEQLKLEDTKI